MSSINLQGLIDKVLGMAQTAIYNRNNNSSDYWKNDNDKLAVERRRDAALAIGQQAIDAKKEDEWKRRMDLSRYGANDPLVREGMPNASKLDQIREENAGELARKQLGLDFDKYKLGRDIDVDIYKTETDRYLKEKELAGKGDNAADEIEAITGALSLTGLPEQTRKALEGRLNSIYSGTPAPEGGKAETPQALPTPAPVQDVGGSVGKFLGENPSTGPSVADINAFRGKSAPGPSIFSPNDQPRTRPLDGLSSGASAVPPPSGFGGSVGKVLYGATHPFETAEKPLTFTRASSPARDAIDKAAFETFPNAVKDTAKAAVEGTAEFGRNVSRGYDAKKEEEAKRKRKNLGYM